MSRKHPVPAKHFCTTLSVNVDNAQLNDAEFRAFVRNTLPIVDYPRPPEPKKHGLQPAEINVPTPPVGMS